MQKENIYLIIVILVAITGGIIFFFSGRSIIASKKEQEQQEIIDCLLANNVKLYISSGCDYCVKQKEVFGGLFYKIDYVECDNSGDWSEECKKAEINSVPTWVFPSNLEVPKKKILSCSDCQKKSGGLLCNDYCYTISEDGKFLRISGILDINKLNEIFDCKEK
jgi:glutaredoxin